MSLQFLEQINNLTFKLNLTNLTINYFNNFLNK